MSPHLPYFCCLLHHRGPLQHTWKHCLPKEYCTVCHCPIFQHQCWSMLQKCCFSLEPLSQLAHHSYCIFGSSLVQWYCVFFCGLVAVTVDEEKHSVTVQKYPDLCDQQSQLYKNNIRKRRFLASHSWRDWLLRWGIMWNKTQKTLESGAALQINFICYILCRMCCVVLLTCHSVSTVW